MLIPEVDRLQADRQDGRGDDGDRPGAQGDGDAAPEGRGQQVRRVLRRRARPPAAGRPGDDRQHGARVRRHLRLLPDRRRDAALPAADRPRRGDARAGRGLRQGATACGAEPTDEPVYTDTLHLDMGTRSCRRSPGRSGRRTMCRSTSRPAPSARRSPSTAASDVSGAADERWTRAAASLAPAQDARRTVAVEGEDYTIRDGSVVIAAITSCTNTSNPYVMIGAGLVARKARAHGAEPQALGQDLAGAGQPGRLGLSGGGRPAGRSRRHRLQPRRLRLHHLHRQLRAARRPDDLEGDRRERPGGDRGAVGQPQLRGPDQPGRAGELPGARRRWSSPTRWPATSTST